jgi:hypothetical protein
MEGVSQEQLPSIKLTKGQKDSYGWEVRVFGKDTTLLVQELKNINEMLKREFGEPR